MRKIPSLALLTCLTTAATFALTACGQAEQSMEGSAPESSAPESSAPASAPAAANGASNGSGGSALAPLSSQGQPVSQAPAAAGTTAAGIGFDLPQGWQQEAPSSSMRLAQAVIPGEAGEAELAVFYFGPGGGGGVEANLERWIGQMDVAAGTQPERANFTEGEFKVTWVDVAGTLKASTMGTGPTTDQPGSRLLGAVVEGEGGPWFFKVTGPDATVADNRDAFLAMLRTIRRG